MAALGAAIHVLARPNREDADGRVKPGHDESLLALALRLIDRQSARRRGSLRRPGGTCPRLLRAAGQGNERTPHDPVEQSGLPGLERDEPAEHVEKVYGRPYSAAAASRGAG